MSSEEQSEEIPPGLHFGLSDNDQILYNGGALDGSQIFEHLMRYKESEGEIDSFNFSLGSVESKLGKIQIKAEMDKESNTLQAHAVTTSVDPETGELKKEKSQVLSFKGPDYKNPLSASAPSAPSDNKSDKITTLLGRRGLIQYKIADFNGCKVKSEDQQKIYEPYFPNSIYDLSDEELDRQKIKTNFKDLPKRDEKERYLHVIIKEGEGTV